MAIPAPASLVIGPDFGICRFSPSDVTFSDDGQYIILKTNFRGSGGVQGLSKFHTQNHTQSDNYNNLITRPRNNKGIYVYYHRQLTKNDNTRYEQVQGIWSGGGTLDRFPVF